MNYYIFRHGETYFSKLDIPYGDQVETAEILPEGIPAIEKLAKELKNIPTDANFTSPYKRCLQTVEIVKNITGKVFTIDERLHDINAETIDEMVDRISEFYEEIKTGNYENIAICTHGYPIAVLKSLITKGEFEIDKLKSYPDPGALVKIINGKIEQIDFN